MLFSRGIVRLVVAASMLLLAPEPPAAETIVHKKTTYFTIGGRTAEELDRELERNGPLTRSTGSRHPGATEVKFDGELSYVERNGRCEIGHAKVILSTHLILPRWKHRNRAGKDLGMIWDALSSDIKRHEERHAEIARQHARSLERALLALPKQRNCEILQEKVQVLSEKAVEAHDRDQIRFDRIESVNFENRMMRILENRLRKGKSDR